MKQIADETLKDSSAMKSIALLTMIFLPSTALAVSLHWGMDLSSTKMIAEYLQHILLLQHNTKQRPPTGIVTILDLLGRQYTPDRGRDCNIYSLGTES